MVLKGAPQSRRHRLRGGSEPQRGTMTTTHGPRDAADKACSVPGGPQDARCTQEAKTTKPLICLLNLR